MEGHLAVGVGYIKVVDAASDRMLKRFMLRIQLPDRVIDSQRPAFLVLSDE